MGGSKEFKNSYHQSLRINFDGDFDFIFRKFHSIFSYNYLGGLGGKKRFKNSYLQCLRVDFDGRFDFTLGNFRSIFSYKSQGGLGGQFKKVL